MLAMTPVGTAPRDRDRLRRELGPSDARMLLFDVKTVHGGSGIYTSAAARDRQSGAVDERARVVAREYERHAEALDLRLYGQHSTAVLDHLHSFGPVCGLAVGHYGEASADVHELVGICADRSAEATWRSMGARSQAEARSFYVTRYRRDLGVAFALAFIQHRTRRTPQVGMSHDAVRALAQRRGGHAATLLHAG